MLISFVDPMSLPPWQRVHPEWVEFEQHDRWLYDSWEGGARYRNARYGYDRDGLPIYNLVRHKHERPIPTDPSVVSIVNSGVGADVLGEDATARAPEGDYEYRRSRTPVPPLMKYAVDAHLSKLYAREVERSGPADLTAWFKDADGRGTSFDSWMKSTIAPMFLVFGKLDVLFDHPTPPDDVEVQSLADKAFYKLGTCIASFILPWNMRWWRLDQAGRYAECVVMEPKEGVPYMGMDARSVEYRHWTATESTLYDGAGIEISKTPHGFGRVPIVRVFDQRIPRLRNSSASRYEAVAEYQREYYNRDSELILSDTHQAFPLIQGPEDYIKAGVDIPIGPTFLLPMKKNSSGADATYQGFEVIPFPKDGAESIRKNKSDIIDAVDRAALLTKPAGAAGSNGSTVAQSGVSKRLDQSAGNDLLTKISERLEAAELEMARMALSVLTDGAAADDPSLLIVYPKTFDLATAEELSAGVEQYQAVVKAAGATPFTETEMLKRLVRQIVPGLLDGQYKQCDDEIKAAVDDAADRLEESRKAQIDAAQAAADAASTATVAPPPQIDSPAKVANAEEQTTEPSNTAM